MDEERYFLFNKEEDFPLTFMDGLAFVGGKLSVADGAEQGVFLSGLMDSSEEACRWRRVRVDCERADGVQITFYAADTKLDYMSLNSEINSSAPLERKLIALERFNKGSVSGARDFLIRDISARFLAISVRLRRTIGSYPRLSYIQVWCREESMLKYLPEIYHENDSFLDRYLKIFASQHLEMERRIEHLRAHFDPQTASDDELRQLAGMLNIDHIHLWETERLRQLLCKGIYRKKGTFDGLKQLVAIYTGSIPLIAERFRMTTGIEENDMLYSGAMLTIVLASLDCDLPKIRSLHLIIQWFIPAGVDYTLIAAPNGIVLSNHSYLGINSHLSEYARAAMDEQNGLQYVVLDE